MALCIKTDGTQQLRRPVRGDTFTLAELQEIVGGYIEMVWVHADEDRLMVLNEDGKRLELAVNCVATALYHGAGGALDDYIVGDVLVGTRRELGG